MRVRVASDGIRIGAHRPRVCYTPIELVRVVALIFPHDHSRVVHVHVANTTLVWMTNALLGVLCPRARLTIHVHLDSLVTTDYRENAALFAVLRAHRLRAVAPHHFVRRVL